MIRVAPANVRVRWLKQLTPEALQRLADEDLMTLVERKDPDAFAVLYDRHGGAAYSLAHRIVGDPAVAEDVTQEAFLSVWRSGARFDAARGSVRSWTLGHRPQPGDRRAAARRPARRRSSTSTTTRCSRRSPPASSPTRRRSAARPRAGCAARCGELPDEQSRGDRARLLRRLHPLRDRRDAGDAAGYGEGADAAGAGEDPRHARRADGRSTGPRRCCRERRDATATRCATTSPPTRSGALDARRGGARSSATSSGCERCRERLRWLDARGRPAAGLGRAARRRRRACART